MHMISAHLYSESTLMRVVVG